MLRIAICDDENEQIELLKGHIVRVLFRLNIDANIETFTSGELLLEACKSGKSFEAIFLDIKMADANGIDTAKHIREHDRKAFVIFVTGSADYMQVGYEVRAFRYLLKPATEEMIGDVINHVLRELQLGDRDCISFKENGSDIRADVCDIICFEAQNHKIILTCVNAAHSFYGRLGDIEKKLSNKGFVRCHKGYLVNVVHIRRIGKSQILLDNGSSIPVSSNYLRQTKDSFLSILR